MSTNIGLALLAALPLAVNALSYGNAGNAFYFRETLDFPDELSYRALLAENIFIDDYGLIPHRLAYSQGVPTLFNSISDVTMEAWVKPVPTEQQLNPQKGCCWPVFGTYLTTTSSANELSLTFADAHTLTFYTTHQASSDPCNSGLNSRAPVGSYDAVWDGQWHHVAVTFSSATLTKYYYLDGKLKFNVTCTSPLVARGGTIVVGTTDDSNPKSYWEGGMDEIRLWNVSRTIAQIQDSMNRVLTPAEIAKTLAYYTVDNYDKANPYVLPDLGPLGLDLTMGRDPTMSGSQERLTPNIGPSTAPVVNSNISMPLYRANLKIDGTYQVATAAPSEASQWTATITTLFPASAGIDILSASGQPLIAASLPFSFVSTTNLTLRAKASSASVLYKDGVYQIPLTLTFASSNKISIFVTAEVKTARDIGPGNAGSALYCNGRNHAYAKDFSLGAIQANPAWTVEFWAYQFYILPLQTVGSVFSIGNWEVSFPGSWCWSVKSPGVPNESFCRGRMEMDLPDNTGMLNIYSGWDANTNKGNYGYPVTNKYGQWYHVAISTNGSYASILINGEVVATYADYGMAPNPSGDPMGLWLCSWPFWGGGFEHNYRGFIDEFRIWNSTRTQAQIKSYMYRLITDSEVPTMPDLLSYYHFDELAAMTDQKVSDTIYIAKDSGNLKTDMVLGGCVPNRAPYCKNTNGTCISTNAPQVPCYTFTNETVPAMMPTQYRSSAPVYGYANKFIIQPGSNTTLVLSAPQDPSQSDVTSYSYVLTSIPQSTSGILYASDGVTVLNAGSVIKTAKVIFVPAPGRGGAPLDSVNFTVTSSLTQTSSSVSLSLNVMCAAGSYLTASGDCLACPYATYQNNASFATSCQEYQNLLYTNGAGIFLMILNAIATGITLAIAVFTILKFNKKVMIAASRMFILIILAGCLLGHAIIFTIPAIPNDMICKAQPIVEICAYSLVMLSIVLKTYRIDCIFNNPMGTKNKFVLSNIGLFSILMLGILVDAAIFIAWYVSDVPTAQVLLTSDGSQLFWGCSSSSSTVQTKYTGIIVGYQILLTLVALLLGVRVRNVSATQFNESKYIVMSIYTITILSITLLPVIFLGGQLSYFIRQILSGIIGCFLCSATAVIMFVPKLQIAVSMGDSFTGISSQQTQSTTGAGTTSKAETKSYGEFNEKDSSDKYFSLPNAQFKLKGQMSYDVCDVFILVGSRLLMARRVNQSVVTVVELKSITADCVKGVESDHIIDCDNRRGQHFYMKLDAQRYQAARMALEKCASKNH